jgi:nitrogen fixation NifU-like protein
MYSKQVLAQFQNPRFVGELPDATIYVQVDNPACGDIMRLSLKVHDSCISDVRFRAKGCVAAIASGSQLCELLHGRTIAEIQSLRREDIITALGGLPPASIHASHLAFDALHAALRQLPIAKRAQEPKPDRS